MLWTVISQADVFYQAAQGSRAPRSSNPFDYLNNGYSLEGASLFGGQDHVVFNCDISSRRTGSHLDTDRKSTRLNSSHVKRSRMPSSA